MVLIEKRAFDEICNHLLALEEKVSKFVVLMRTWL